MASTRLFATAFAASASLALAACGSGGTETASETSGTQAAPPEDAAMITADDGSTSTPDASTEAAASQASEDGENAVKRISFNKGANSATVTGSVKGYGIIDYMLNVRAGQPLNISMSTDNRSNYFNIMEPGEDDAAIFVGSTNGDQFEGVTKKSGDYRIRVYLMRNAARREETAKFRLETIVGAGKPPKQTASADPVRGPGGLEKKCQDKVAGVTNARVLGTNRIEESEAATAIYVNVQGAEAPWRCLVYPRSGTVGEVMYTGSEGAL